MKRSFQSSATVVLGTGLVAATYGLVRYAYGLSVPAAQRDLGLSTAAAGAVSGATSVAYCVAAVLAFWACERWPRAVVTAAGAVAATGALGAGLATGPTAFATAVVLGSAGAGAASPGLVVLVRRAVAAPRRDAAQSLVNAGTGPGLVAAGVIAVVAGSQWQRGWVVAAAVTAGLTVALLVGTRGLAGDDAPPTGLDLSRAWARPLLAAVLLGTGSAAVWTWGRAVLEDGGLSPTRAVGAWIALGLGATLAAIATPRLLRHGVSLAWAACVLATAVATVLLAVGPLPWLAAALFGLGHTAATTVLIAWAGRVTRTPGPAVAAFFVALLAGQAVGAPLAGALLPHGAPLAFGVAAAVTALAALPRPTTGEERPSREDGRGAPGQPRVARLPCSRSSTASASVSTVSTSAARTTTTPSASPTTRSPGVTTTPPIATATSSRPGPCL